MHGCSSCMAWSAFVYSCLLFSMCNAYAEIGLFVLMYLMCLWCHIPIDLPFWPTYELLQVFLHFNLYMLLEFILLSGILSQSWLYMVLFVLKAIFMLVFLNNLVYEWTVICEGDPFFLLLCLCRCDFCFFVLGIILSFSLWIFCNGKPLFLATVRTVFHYCCFACSLITSAILLFM